MKLYLYILVMAVTTYLVRALPLLLMKKPIRSQFLRSFLHYVPVACLTAMTFPAILYTTDHPTGGVVGLAVAVVLALKNKSLILVAAGGCLGVFLTEKLMEII
jgi:branched-subunit amino acid transport protein